MRTINGGATSLPRPMDPDDILAEFEESRQAVIDEATSHLVRPDPATHSPDHGEMSVHRWVSSTFDDHATSVGQCLACGAWIVRTEYVSGRVEDRAMSGVGLELLVYLEGRRRDRGDAL